MCMCVAGSESSYDVEFNHLLRGMEGIVTDSPPSVAGLSPQQAQSMQRLAQLPAFSNVAALVHNNAVSARWLSTGAVATGNGVG